MVKLTPELIQQSAQYINPVRDRELDLRGSWNVRALHRDYVLDVFTQEFHHYNLDVLGLQETKWTDKGYKIPVIENLGATLDQFDCVDLSDNDVRKLDGFPLLKRLKSLLLNNNRICRIAENLEESLPYLESLIMTNNHIQELGDIDPLSTIKSLVCLSLMKNPVSSKKHYRLYTIHKVPQLRLLDFRKIRQKEREEAARLFKGKKGKQLEREISKRSKTFVPGASIPAGACGSNDKPSGPSAADVQAIKAAIAKASTLEEVEKLNLMLKAGQIPGKETQNQTKTANKSKIAEEEEMDIEPSVSNGK